MLIETQLIEKLFCKEYYNIIFFNMLFESLHNHQLVNLNGYTLLFNVELNR